MRHYAKKVAAIGFLVFLALWIVGVVRGLTLPFPPPPPLLLDSGPDEYGRGASQNQKVANNLRQLGMEKTPLPLVIDQAEIERIQVHEKTADLTTGSADFETDARS